MAFRFGVAPAISMKEEAEPFTPAGQSCGPCDHEQQENHDPELARSEAQHRKPVLAVHEARG